MDDPRFRVTSVSPELVDLVNNCPAGRGKRAECSFCANDDEQCHRDLDCEIRAWANGFCGPHQPNPGAYH